MFKYDYTNKMLANYLTDYKYKIKIGEIDYVKI